MARLAAFLRSDSMLNSIMRWYSFKCFFSSFWLFGGSQLGRVLLNTFSFSLLIGNGSIMMLVNLSGGNSTVLVFALESFAMRGSTKTSPFWTASSCFRSAVTAWFSNVSVKAWASSDSSDNATFHDLVREGRYPPK